MFQAGLIITNVDTSPTRKLGELVFSSDNTNGPRGYMYVQAPASTALAVGDAVLINGSGVASACTTTTTTPGDAAGRRVGIVTVAVSSSASAQYIWVQVYGLSAVNVAASCVRNTVLNTTATAGRLDDDATAGAEVIDGCVLNATAGGAAVTACTLNFPHVGRTL